jgi:glycosidase
MIKKYTLSFVFLLLGIGLLRAQLLTSDPAFPAADQAVTITFNAALGDAGLKGFTGDVYAHTGVITDKSTSGSDWKYVKAGWSENIPACKLTRIGTDLYTLNISPTIRAFYGVPSGETIKQLAFVFRSADGSKTGRMSDGGDIFYDVYPSGINVQITLPEDNPDIVHLNDSIHVEWNSSHADSTFLYLDQTLLLADTGSTFHIGIQADAYGKHWLVAKAVSEDQQAFDSTYFYVSHPVDTLVLPNGVRDGINYLSDTSAILCLYAPGKKTVFALGDFNQWEVGDDALMNITPDGKRFWIQLNGLVPHKEYVFQYFIDASVRIGDPYADKVSDPWNDQYISDATYPNLIAYLKGKTTGIATVLQTAQVPYSWKVNDFKTPDLKNAVVYELLVRDFTEGHSFNSLIDTLNYLKRLGVTAIELMPVSEFEGNLSWGYNPNYYFAPDKYYGPKDTFKAFVDACHEKGIAVVMDMVLNHAYGTCPLAMMYWDAANNRPAADNPWFNQTSPNPTYSWGNDFNHESPDTKRFVDSVNHYWISEYKIDGFRFDFTKGFTNTPGDGSGYDQSRIDILTRMANAIWSYKPDAYVILEHFADNSEEKVLTTNGMSVWGNLNYNYNEATMGYVSTSNFSWISYKNRGYTNPAGVMGYMESHDEERLMYKNEQFGNTSGSYSVKDIPTALKRMELAGTFFFPIPGPKMIWQFGELGYDYSIDFNGRVGEKPIRWDYYQDANRKHLYGVWAALIHLKETQPAFQTTDYSVSLSGAMKTIHLNGQDMDVAIVGNFDVNSGSVNLSFQKNGTWYEYFSGDSLEVNDNKASLSLQAGEYRLYTSKKLDQPDFILGVNDQPVKEQAATMQVFPNPARESFELKLNIENAENGQLSLYDLTGRKVKTLFSGKFQSGLNAFRFNTDHLNRGLYLLVADTPNQRKVTRLVIQ